jgi:hypothetical protein
MGLPHKNHFKIESEDVQSYLLGNSAYPLRVGLMKCFSSKATGTPQQNLFYRKWRAGRLKIENASGILKNKFQILRNLNMGLEYAPIIIIACCILHNFLIEEGDIGGDDQDKSNSKAPSKFEYISKDERRSKNIAKQQRDTIFNKWVKEKYRMEEKKLREKK